MSVMKVKASLLAEVGSSPSGGVHYRPIMIPRVKDLSMSIHVGTRKMVNYACVG